MGTLENNIEGLDKYRRCFTPSLFVEKISKVAKRAGAKLVYVALVLYYTLMSGKVSAQDKLLIISALGYLVSPLDAIPDAFPIVGLGDDLAVLLYVMQKVAVTIPADAREKAYEKLSDWFDEDEVNEANDVK